VFGRQAFERLVPAVVNDMARHPIPRATILRYVACGRAQDLLPPARRVDAETLIVTGVDDRLTGDAHAHALRAAIDGARLERIPDCGHTPQVERPAELARAIAGFLAPGGSER
jgi:pimeloyl-ACP methyl ester carboxylesterase